MSKLIGNNPLETAAVVPLLSPEQLKNLAAQLEPIIAYMPGFIFWKNTQSQYIWCNQNLADILGLKQRWEIYGKTDYDFPYEKASADQFIADDKEVMRTGKAKSTEYEMPIKRSDGQNFYVRTDKLPLFDDKNQIIGVLAVAIDITDQKRSERETHLAHTFVEDILYNLPGLIYWKNKDSQYIGFNKNVVQLSGLTREELVGKTDGELNWGKSEGESFKLDDQEVMETGIVNVTEYEIPIKREDGHFMMLRTEKSRLFDRLGNVVGVLGVAMDITDQKILEDKLIEEKEKVEKLSLAKTEFIHNMEHDIRTPFSGIYSMVKILEEKEEDKEKRSILNAIGQCAKELLDYCNGILDFSVTESKTRPIILKKFDLKALMLQIIDMEKPVALNKKLKLSMDFPDNMPRILIGDKYRILRILINLVGNATKFTHTGYVKISVQLAKEIEGKQVVVRFYIEDTGIGIPKDKQAYIYEKFSRLTPTNQGKYKGSGLGLSIVKHLVDELEGEIEVESTQDKGTLFVCTLPLRRPLVDDILFEEHEDDKN
jgi:two-component system aerobic respiration control sensor histidine kinase ArcB